MNTRRLILFLLCSIVTASCTSSERSSERTTPTQAVNPPVSQPVSTGGSERNHVGGYLYGDIFMDFPAGLTAPVQVIMSEDGRFRATQLYPYGSPQSITLLTGNYVLEGAAINGGGYAIANDGTTWMDGSTVTTLTIAGTLWYPTSTTNSQLSLTWTTAAGDAGRLDAKFAELSGYYGPLKSDGLPGTWVALHGANGSWYPDPYRSDPASYPPPGTAQWTITPDRAIFGEDSDGCVTTGEVRNIDERFSVWEVSYTVSECGRSGDYSGLIIGDNGWYDQRSFALTADDGQLSQVLEFWKQ